MKQYTLTSQHLNRLLKNWFIPLLCYLLTHVCVGQHDTIPALQKQLSIHQQDTTRVNILNELSYQFQWMDFDSALSLAEESLVLASELKYDKGIALANCRKAYCFLLQGMSKLSLQHALLANQLAERENFPEIAAESYRILAFSYLDQKEFEIAKNYIQQAERVALQTSDWRLIASVYNIYGNIERAIDSNDTSLYLNLYRRSFTILQEHKTSEFYMSSILSNIGASYLLLPNPDPDKAILFLNKAILIARQTNNRVTEAGITGDLGTAYLVKKEYAQANEYLQRSLVLARELKLKRVIRYVYHVLSEVKAQEGKTKEAMAYLNSFYEINDSIKTTREIVEFEAQQAITILEQEKKIQRIWNAILVIGTFFLLVFITIIYKLQQSRNRKALELITVQQQLNTKLQETDQLKSKFFANISHEFRTPLSLIIAPIERMLSSEGLPDDQKKDLRLMSRNATRLLSLINQLLDLSRLEVGKMHLHIQRGNVEEFAKILASSFDSFAETRGIKFTRIIEVPAYDMDFDRDKLEKIISNILFNAFKFTSAGGDVTLTIRYTPESRLIIEVSDTGKGISEDDLEHVFSPFYQSGNLVDNGYPGTGLGLSLVQELVKLYQGQITLDSKPGKGTKICVVLPVYKSNLMESQQDTNAAVPFAIEIPEHVHDTVTHYKNDASTETILVVEDSDELRVFIASCFTSSYTVLTAQHGEEGFALAVEHVPDLVISDVMMPKMDGILLTEKLKDDERTSHIPIVLLTAKTDATSRLDGFRKGADDYLAKPFSSEELIVRVNNLIEGRKKLIALYRSAVSQPAPRSEELPTPILSLDDKFIANLRNIIHTNLGNSSFSVEQLSEEMCLSRTQLFRKVKSMLGMSPNELINDIRLQRAAELIKAKADTLTQISYSVGFNEQSYFAKRFRIKFGVSPKEYGNQK